MDFPTESHQKHITILSHMCKLSSSCFDMLNSNKQDAQNSWQLREQLLLELKTNVQENSKVSSLLVAAAGAAVASHPCVRVRLSASKSFSLFMSNSHNIFRGTCCPVTHCRLLCVSVSSISAMMELMTLLLGIPCCSRGSRQSPSAFRPTSAPDMLMGSHQSL